MRDPNPIVEEDDYFYDSRDFIQGPASSPTSEYVSTTTEVLKFHGSEYERWRNELQSVDERRRSFLSEMGFYSHRLSQLSFSEEADLEVECYNNSVLHSERMATTSDASSVCSTSDTDDILDSILSNTTTNKERYECSLPLSAGSETRPSFSGNGKVALEDTKGKRWKSLLNKFKSKKLSNEWKSCANVSNLQLFKPKQVNSKCSNKSFKELTGVYLLQSIQAHGSSIRTMKFSPDGKYLASGCEDGTIRIWGITEVESTYDSPHSNMYTELEKEVINNVVKSRKKGSKTGSIALPKRIFGINETPVQEFREHTACILDLCWSKRNYLLSSSEDKTVRLWQMDADKCLKVFYHSNYVTCIHFNPADERYFMSGSIDGKVRVWAVSDNEVVDWSDVSDIVTAACYQPDGHGLIVGSIEGNCHVYSVSGNYLELEAQFKLRGKRNSRTNRITSFQFSSQDPQRIMITFADSRVTILDGLDKLNACRVRHFSDHQDSTSFSCNDNHVISVDDDSRIYLWSCDPLEILPSKKQPKCIKSCEQFLSEGVSVAVPWLGIEGSSSARAHIQLPENLSCVPHHSGFFDKRILKHSATWPEEKLTGYLAMDGEKSDQYFVSCAPAWSLVIVTGGWDGQIRCYQNFGMPSR